MNFLRRSELKLRKVSPHHFRLAVSGAGPAGLSAALAAVRFGVKPSEIVVFEARHRDLRPGGYGSRDRVVLLDGQTSQILIAHGIDLPGAKLRFMTAALGDEQFAYIPNNSGWRTVFEGVVGPRHLDRLATISELEDQLLSRFSAQGGAVCFGRPTELRLTEDGTGEIEVGGRRISADLIVIAEGDQSCNAAATTQRLSVTAGTVSAFITIDLAATPNGRWQAGDLMAAFHEPTGRLVYGYAATENLSVSTLLPRSHDPGAGMDALRTFNTAFGLAEPTHLNPAFYQSALSMADRCWAGVNVVVVGDALRTSDPVSGAGANSAVFDGEAVGAFFFEQRAVGPAQARARMTARLRQSTATALELSLLFREQAEFWLANSGLYRFALRLGLRHRNSEGLNLDTAKSALAGLPRLTLGEQIHAALIRNAASLIGAPPPAFGSPDRQRAIGLPHPGG